MQTSVTAGSSITPRAGEQKRKAGVRRIEDPREELCMADAHISGGGCLAIGASASG